MGPRNLSFWTRRRFLLTSTLVPAIGGIASTAAFSEETRRQTPYLALAPFVQPTDLNFPCERQAEQIVAALAEAVQSRSLPFAPNFTGSSPNPTGAHPVSEDLREARFNFEDRNVTQGWRAWLESLGQIRRISFYPLPSDIVRYEVASEQNGRLEYRVGRWQQQWDGIKLKQFSPIEEHIASTERPFFRDVTGSVFRDAPVACDQLRKGIPFWRSRLDPATGIDLYGSNGIAVGDINGDGRDEVYVCQPGGLPNRLFQVTDDLRFVDLTDVWGVGLLDDTSCALFLDLCNRGRQDLVVLRSGGPLLFLNEGNAFRQRSDAFHFKNPPTGNFTGMAAADFDRDGKLDLYLCCYVYFQSEAQYTYASPYHDAENGPPNFLFRNSLGPEGDGSFEDCTEEAGLNENNNRFSFAPAWCDYNADGWPDLYVANDFGRKNLYRNQKGRFRDVAHEAGVEDVGPGMSASWFDYDRDGRPDLYVANMWTAAGQRVIADAAFAPAAANERKLAYRGHTKGNSLYRNEDGSVFIDESETQHVAFGRWAWSSGGHDLDNDGSPEILVTCGMLTNQSTIDLESFFWREVVAHAPVTAQPSAAYENGWNALNQFVREDLSWSGREPNVYHARRGPRYFDFSGLSGFDFADDSRAFAVADFDGDGRPDIFLKSRLGPQLRVLQNDCAANRHSIAFALQGTSSNRDGIGARIEVDGQFKWLEAGSGFLSQHSKRVLFGLGERKIAIRVRITWPSGHTQELMNLAAGHTYSVIEGKDEVKAQSFRAPVPLPATPVTPDNSLLLEETWFHEPVPLPEQHKDVRLLVLVDGQPSRTLPGISTKTIDFAQHPSDLRSQYEIFRRYLFDWRTTLSTPIALLLNDAGEAVKIYPDIPSANRVQADILEIEHPPALPYPGVYAIPTRRDYFKFGAAFLWAGYPDQALPYLERVIRQSPSNSRVLVLIGQIHLEARRLPEAEQSFQAALNESEYIAEAWSGLGDVFDDRGNPEQALKNYRKALALKPDLFETLLNAGHAAAKVDTQSAKSFYSKALALRPQSPEAANGLGLAFATDGQFEDARQLFEKAISLRRDYSAAINNLGVLYLQRNQTNDAIAAFQYGIRVSPDEEILYLNLGRTYIRAGDASKARSTMQQLLDRKPGSVTALHALEELGGR